MNFKLHIPNPCSQNWNQMPDVPNGKHCSLCEKNLVDFRKMSPKQIHSFVNVDHKVCGLFSKTQLDAEYYLPKQYLFSKMGLVVSFTSLLAFINPVKAESNVLPKQNQVIVLPNIIKKNTHITQTVSDTIKIKVNVIDEYTLEKLPFVRVYLKEHDEISGTTDFEGEFTIQIPKSMFEDTLVLEVKFIGYKSQSSVITKDVKLVNIKLEEEIDLIGEVIEVVIPTKRQKFFDFFRRKKNKKYTYINHCH